MNNYRGHLAILLFALIYLISCSTSKGSIAKVEEDNSKRIIVEYGEYIYQRENCNSCHTLSILEASSTLISLDGNKGYRSPEWTYLFLQKPKEMMPGCTMPSFSYLNEDELSKETLSIVLKDDISSDTEAFDKYWEQLNNQVEDYLINFETVHYSVKVRSTEIVPLVAYLHEIPPSPHMRYLDSLEAIKQKEKEQVLESYYEQSDSLVDLFSSRPESIQRGEKLYAQNCTICHGDKAQGTIGPNLIDEYWISGGDNESILRSIMEGNENGMPGHKHKLEPDDAVEIVVYVKTLEGTVQEYPKDPEGVKE